MEEILCGIESCNNTFYAKGFCKRHYDKNRNYGNPLEPDRITKFCSVENCNNKHYAKSYCVKHYARWKKHGTTDQPKEFRPRGSGCLDKNGYITLPCPDWLKIGKSKNYRIPQHRLVMSEHLGRPLLDHEEVHHKNGVRTDNRLENLELWSSWHPKGQKVEDKLKWAKELIELYEGQPNMLEGRR